MYVTYNITTGAISGWSNKPRTPASGYAEVQSDDYLDQEHWYYDAATDTFSGPTNAEQDALDMQTLRLQRNELLAQTDWTQVADAPVDAAAWATYRQALRDLPANTTDPRNPTWPTKPS